jgi:hypothetical protein
MEKYHSSQLPSLHSTFPTFLTKKEKKEYLISQPSKKGLTEFQKLKPQLQTQ